MFSNIKLKYFSNLLLSFMIERQRLKLIKYNKSFQKNMNIRIINYKLFSEEYVIYESRGFGKK